MENGDYGLRGDPFGWIVRNPAGKLETRQIAAAMRCGATGLLNCAESFDAAAVRQALERIRRDTSGSLGIQFAAPSRLAVELLPALPAEIEFVVFTAPESAATLQPLIALARNSSRRVLLEVASLEQGAIGIETAVDGLIAHDGASASAPLWQHLLARFALPVWALGEMTPDSAVACYTAGAAGVVLDRECIPGSPLATRFRTVPAILHEFRDSLRRHIQASQTPAAEVLPARKVQPAPLDIAIVGMECLLPKAPHLRAFWDNVINKVDAITEIPRHRFNIDLYYDPDRKTRDKVYSRWGGFLDDVPFDPMRYGIPPNALSSIDPMQLLSLVVVDRALRDAGYHDREFPRETTSVIFGLSGGLGDLGINYAVRSLLPHFIGKVPEELLERLPEWTEDSFAGILLNVAAGRVSNRFNLGGVNFTVDAACASSLAAVYLAARELRDGSSDMVIVGGVDTVQSPFGYLCFSKSQALSGRGRCRTFDASADGIAISEGISVLVLKRLADAERDGDRIYAVIKGVGGSSDGRGRSMTAPRLEGQQLALDRAYGQAGIRPATVGLVEAHGTGTIAGDATELAALAKVFQEDGAAPQSCAVGSVKSMVGHTKSAAGVTGLMKVALALHHQVLPPTLHVEQPNPKLRESGSPLYLPTEAQPWIPAAETPRRAGVSSFGFGGTNFHIVLEEYQGDLSHPADRGGLTDWPAELFLWEGASATALAATLAEPLGSGGLRALAAARAQQPRPEGARLRLAIVASSLEDLASKLATARKALAAGQEKLDDPQGIYLAPLPESPAPIAFLFPGQGSQKPGMLRDLALEFPEFRQSLEQAAQVLAGRYPRPLPSYIYPPAAFTPEEKQRQMQELTDTVVAQPALGAVEIAYHRLLARLGVHPAMTAGHSYAEYVALCAAGVFNEETLLELSAARGRAIQESVSGDMGAMAAVPADAATVAQALEGRPDIVLANYNAPRQTIIAGPTEAVKGALAHLDTAGLKATLLPVSCAFHSPLMQPARDRLAAALANVRYASPAIPVFSNTLAAPYPAAPEEIAQVLTHHLTSPVRFVEEIEAMYAQGARLFVEVGPKGVLSGLTRQILEGRDARILQTDRNDRSGLVQLLHVLAQLAVAGVSIELSELFRGRLLPETQEAPPAWLVNGSRAFSRTQPPAPMIPAPLVSAASIPPPMPPKQPEPPAPQPVASVQPASLPQSGLPPAAGQVDAVMLQFQQLMGQFLQTQAAIMTAFLSGSASSAALPAALPALTIPAPITSPATSVAPPAAPPAPVVQAPAPIPVAALAPAPAAQRDFAAELRRIAAERTGYPVEMLDPDAAIEADLGIDSIKRTEILSAFQRACSPDEQKRVQAVLDSLTSARTLREISDRLTAALAGSALAPAQVPLAAPASSSTRDYAAELCRIAAERTGYPVEMLDPDAAIEADLGIDSIKRTEILSAFQRACSPDEQKRVQAILDSLTSARTLREISDRLTAALAGSAPAPAQVPLVAPASSSTRDYAAELRRIAAERTGYPVEMLDPDAAIEADLGIDSIKRTEILSAFQRACSPDEQKRVQAVLDSLTGARTLREISDRLTTALAPANNAAPAPAAPVQHDCAAELCRIAAERTGYPVEMLDPDAAIEADLGIDSIKRTEILSAFQRACSPDEQKRVQAVLDSLTSARTLREISDRLAAALSAGAAAPLKTVASAASTVPRFLLVAADQPRRHAKPQTYPGRVCLITDDETGLAAGLAEQWNAAGERALLLRHSTDITIAADGVFSTDLTNPPSIQSVIDEVRRQYGAIGAIVHLLPLRANPTPPDCALADWRDLVRQDVKSLYALARATEADLKQTGRTGGAMLAVVTARGGEFGLRPDAAVLPTHHAVADFTKTLALEFSGVLVKVLDLDPSDPVAILREKLFDELTSQDETLQVGMPGDRRLTVLPRVAPVRDQPLRRITRDWVFLLTGGARGITAEIARLLAERHQPTLILAGASPQPSESEPAEIAGIHEPAALKAALTARLRASAATVKPAEVEAAYQRVLKRRQILQTLEDLRRLGARASYHSVDVRDEAAFGSLLDRIYQEHGRLDVVIHGAGIIEDKLIKDKTPESFDRVVHTKADSAFLLSRKLRTDSLQCLLFMSSITAAFGNRAQADYAAANGVMNGLAVELAARWPCRVAAMNWGPWDQSGMVTEEMRQQFLSRSVHLIPPDGGAEATLREIESGDPGEPLIAFGDGPWNAAALPAAPTWKIRVTGSAT